MEMVNCPGPELYKKDPLPWVQNENENFPPSILVSSFYSKIKKKLALLCDTFEVIAQSVVLSNREQNNEYSF